MLSKIDMDISFDSVKQFASNLNKTADSFNEKLDVIVKHNKLIDYLYKNIDIYISYNTAYMDYKVEIIWEYDKKQKDYKSLDLHGYYSTNFQKFSYEGGNLCFVDGNNEITILGVIE